MLNFVCLEMKNLWLIFWIKYDIFLVNINNKLKESDCDMILYENEWNKCYLYNF